MNRNIFIKNKKKESFDQNKYNPDVIQRYSDLNNKRNNTKFDFLNKPYKMIIKDKIPAEINSHNDLKISMKENKIDVNKNFNKLVENRKYLDDLNEKTYNEANYNKNKNHFDFRNYQVSKISQDSKSFESLKKTKISYYNQQKETINHEKSKYNEIMSNLKKQGII